MNYNQGTNPQNQATPGQNGNYPKAPQIDPNMKYQSTMPIFSSSSPMSIPQTNTNG